MLTVLRKSKGISAILETFSHKQTPLEIDDADDALSAILLALMSERAVEPFLAVTPSERDATELSANLGALGVDASVLDWWGAVPYRYLNPFSPVFGSRARSLAELASGKARVVIAPERAFFTLLPPLSYIASALITVKRGDALSPIALAGKLTDFGYIRTPKAQNLGDFSLRGGILDVFMADDEAYRMVFDFDSVESIKRFNPFDQSGAEKISQVIIHPLKEVVWTDDRIDVLSRNLRKFDEFPDNGAAIIESLIERRTVDGEELLFPLAFEEPASLLSYFTRGAVFFFDKERLIANAEILEKEYHSFFVKATREREVPKPERIFRNWEWRESAPPKRGGAEIQIVSFMRTRNPGDPQAIRLSAGGETPRSFFGNMDYMKEEFGALSDAGWRIIVAAESDLQAKRIRGVLEIGGERDAASRIENNPPLREKTTASFNRAPLHPKHEFHPPVVVTLPISAGFALPDVKLMVVQENEIFSRRRRPPPSLKTAQSAVIDTFVELKPGDFVVHVNYGVGLFKSIDRVRALGRERDYIKIEYADQEVVFVPIEQVNLVQRYIGNEGAPPRLDRLGSKYWEYRKAQARKAAEELAGRLLELYSKRKASVGFTFPPDGEWQDLFEAGFPFDETEDQLRCVAEIKADMESVAPMDRLVCGDVGYGKTEVALRACFKAIMAGKQAVFLAPTTVLVEQHFENFRERFAYFPVKIAMLSRLAPPKEAKQTLTALERGEIDLVIGTHRAIQKDVRFKNLGLIVIDEEQRFGVKDKERLKELKTNVDCLSLSATPIPRTLHMSLLKIRDMSLLATPPRNRLPIETFVGEFDEERIVSAVRAEIERGGQVFYLHNRIEDLDDVRLRLESLVPEAMVATAHGQMQARDLEDVMHRFVHGGFHVLVSTTIIENGLDIPNVNTIIINHAERYGASQLYQLRGRVGRSDREAYAYLFYPKNAELSEEASQRLEAIQRYTELGSGFKIAMKDMEIRGAGNLLGREQSGNIYSVGFDMYMRLLDEAVRKLERSDYSTESETLLELEYSGFIPDSYMGSAQMKMEFYKKIAAIASKEEKERLEGELSDRFGPPPDEVASLLSLAEIRIICREIGVSSLQEHGGFARIVFSRVANVHADRLVRMIAESGGKVRLDPKASNAVILATRSIGLKEKSEFIREKLSIIAG
ncbi:MAG: transcription-repair coupling factor [Treponema sp.]|jgi:transcription-repair coupling factor (superfamily II helicase)|nr:transcription-repair coupling factor [Treponema sp.]